MRLDRTFYRSWYLVVLGSLWPLLLLGVNAQPTTGQYESTIQDESSGEVQDVPGNFTSDEQMIVSGKNNSKSSHNSTQDNQIDIHQEILPKDHFIWSENDLTYVYEGQALVGHVMVQHDNAYSVTQCSDRCMRHVPECRSYNYQVDTHICELNSKSDLEVPEDLQNITGTTYYRTTAFQTPRVSTLWTFTWR